MAPSASVDRLAGLTLDISRDLHAHRQEFLRTGPQTIGRAEYSLLLLLPQLGPCSITKLSEELWLDISTISRQIDTLVDQGFVLREQDPADRRSRLIQVSETGREHYNTYYNDLQKRLKKSLGKFSQGEAIILTELLDRLQKNLQKHVYTDQSAL